MTFKVFMATGPCQYPLYTVPNEPIPIFFLFTLISLAGISQSSIDSFGTFFILLAADSSADEALDLGGLVEVGEDKFDVVMNEADELAISVHAGRSGQTGRHIAGRKLNKSSRDIQ